MTAADTFASRPPGLPVDILKGYGLSEAAVSDMTAWQRRVTIEQRAMERRLYGPTAPKRKRRKRVQRKIDGRHGALHYRNAAMHRLRAIMEDAR